MARLLSVFPAFFCCVVGVGAETKTFDLVLRGGKHQLMNVPVVVASGDLGPFPGVKSVEIRDQAGKIIPAQLTQTSLSQKGQTGDKDSGSEVHFILADLKADASQTLKLTLSTQPPPAVGFAWAATAEGHTDLFFENRPVLRYMHAPYDDSTKENRDLTYKVFHHLYDPTGKRLVTKGPGGLYPHHRGLYYGFSKITYGKDAKADTWHCTGNVHQSHQKILRSEAGPVLGRHLVAIHWHGPEKDVFAKELRELTVYNIAGGRLVEFASRLEKNVDKIKLDGDPQHAGFQFRADNEVAAKTIKQTYYLRPDGPGKPGETRNWPEDKTQVNLPWHGMSFVLGDQRYTALYLDKPTNPKEARFSERDYGRFGSYFEHDLNETKPALDVNYRLWLQEGELSAEQAKAHSSNFVTPVDVKVKKKE